MTISLKRRLYRRNSAFLPRAGKRILTAGKEAIRREVERIMPFMVREGGYVPSCDHGVPDEAAFDDYLYYRELMRQY